jgi:hypothetical protein
MCESVGSSLKADGYQSLAVSLGEPAEDFSVAEELPVPLSKRDQATGRSPSLREVLRDRFGELLEGIDVAVVKRINSRRVTRQHPV